MLNRKSLFPVLLLAAGVLILFFPNLFGGKTLFLRDITYIFHPWKSFAAESLQRGALPLWNPYVFCGMPFIANWQSAVFYPFSVFFYFFGFETALKLFHCAHFFAAGLFAYLFAKSRGFSGPAAAALAFVFAFNGYTVTRMEFLSHLSVDIWLFMLLLLAGNPASFAVTLAFSFFGGHQMFFIQLVAVAAWVLLAGRAALKPGRVAAAALLFFGLIAVQFVPTFALAKASARAAGGIDYSVAMLYSVSPSGAAGLISRWFQQIPSELLAGESFSWVNTFNVGFLAFLLALAGIIRKGEGRIKIFSIALAAAGLFIAAGSFNPLAKTMFGLIPAIRLFRYPVQFMYLCAAGLALLAASGVQSFRYRALLPLLILAELLATNFGFQISAPSGFFRAKTGAVPVLQSMPAGKRFILSPGTEKTRYVAGKTTVEAWGNARGLLYNLTCIPFHLYNAYGYGEPLVPASAEKMADAVYAAKTAQDSAAGFASLGAQYLICRSPLPSEKNYLRLTGSPPFVYSLAGDVTRAASKAEVRVLSEEPGKITAHAITGGPVSLLWKDTFFEGWKCAVNGARAGLEPDTSGFRVISLPRKGEYNIIQYYDPDSFRAAAAVSALAVLLLGFYGYAAARRPGGSA